MPQDAVEALSWANNGEWGSPKDPWLPGAVLLPLVYLPALPGAGCWYASHFVAVAVGMLGTWQLARRLCHDEVLAGFSQLSLGLSGGINVDIIPYNDNYLLVMLWLVSISQLIATG